MTAHRPDGERDVVPRWRSVRRTLLAGEFQRLPTQRELTPHQAADIEAAALAWQRDRDVISASEYVGVALVAGDSAVAGEAASFLAEGHGGALLAELGNRALNPSPTAGLDHGSPTGAVASVDSVAFVYDRLARQKARLRIDPRNPIAWADLARRYTALGQFERARRALSIARGLAPLSRYLLRATTRFYVHIGEPDVAYDMLRNSSRTRADPWLMAAMLSVGSISKARIGSLRTARCILNDDSFRPIERADLASELATFDLRAGADRKARVLFNRSLQTPTDNSLAQVQWASHRLGSMEVRLDETSVAFPAEAYARSASELGQWEEVLRHAEAWIEDQPFDNAAANIASYAASVGLEDWKRAIDFAQLGLRSQPREPILLNNLAYALLESGRVDEADAQLQLLDLKSVTDRERVALLATHGLLRFRRGDRLGGVEGYEAAIRLARQLRDPKAEEMARTMLFREQITAMEPGEAAAVVKRLTEASRNLHDPALTGVVNRVQQMFARLGW